jgi:hypothetical protein
MPHEVFICYKRSSGDDLAVRLKEALREFNIPAFVDTMDIPKKYESTDKWWEYRNQAIANCKIFAMIVTAGFEKSSEIVKEIKLARDKKREFMCFRWAKLNPEIAIDLGNEFLNIRDIEQIPFSNASELVRQFFDNYSKQNQTQPEEETIEDRKIQSASEESHPPLIHYEITQLIQNTMLERMLPDVGFYIRSWHPHPVKARVKARIILDGKDLGMEKGEYRNGKYVGYYNGQTEWNLNPYTIVFGHFSIPQECVEKNKTLTIEVRVTLEDQNGQVFNYLPVAWTHIRESNVWFFEPVNFS